MCQVKLKSRFDAFIWYLAFVLFGIKLYLLLINVHLHSGVHRILIIENDFHSIP